MRRGCGMNADLQNWIPRLVRILSAALVNVRSYMYIFLCKPDYKWRLRFFLPLWNFSWKLCANFREISPSTGFFQNLVNLQERIQDFHLEGGGGAKDYVNAGTLQARNQTHFWQGSREALRLFNLSFYLTFIFKHSDKKNWKTKTKLIQFFLGGARLLPPPPRIRHWPWLWERS